MTTPAKPQTSPINLLIQSFTKKFKNLCFYYLRKSKRRTNSSSHALYTQQQSPQLLLENKKPNNEIDSSGFQKCVGGKLTSVASRPQSNELILKNVLNNHPAVNSIHDFKKNPDILENGLDVLVWQTKGNPQELTSQNQLALLSPPSEHNENDTGPEGNNPQEKSSSQNLTTSSKNSLPQNSSCTTPQSAKKSINTEIYDPTSIKYLSRLDRLYFEVKGDLGEKPFDLKKKIFSQFCCHHIQSLDVGIASKNRFTFSIPLNDAKQNLQEIYTQSIPIIFYLDEKALSIQKISKEIFILTLPFKL
jgi:hypothetical protein